MVKLATTNQILKALGHFKDTKCKDVDKVATPVEGFALLQGRFCDCPDYYDDEIADETDPERLAAELALADVDEATGLITHHKRMRARDKVRELRSVRGSRSGASTTGSGSWPADCHPDYYPGRHSVKYFVDVETFPSHYTRPVLASELDEIVAARVWGLTKEATLDLFDEKPMLDVALWMVDEAYRRVGCAQIRVYDGVNGSEHQIHLKSVAIPGNVIGRAWYNNGSCSDHVNNHIDSTYRPGLMGTAKLVGHEFGHNHNLDHEFKNQGFHHSVMSYDPGRYFYGFSTGDGLHTLPRDASLDALQSQYGTEEIGDGPVIVDPTEPDDWTVTHSWSDDQYDWQQRRRKSHGGGGIVWK